MKEYIRNGKADNIKDILKIRLHIWDVKRNYLENEEDAKCSI